MAKMFNKIKLKRKGIAKAQIYKYKYKEALIEVNKNVTEEENNLNKAVNKIR